MKISFIGDVHIGNKAADEIALVQILKKSDKVILMGDMIEGITKKDIRHDVDSILSYSEQITKVIKILQPYKKKIMWYVIGNHEDTLLSRTDIDSVDLICTPLQISVTYTKILHIDGLDIFITHGTGAGITYQGAVTKILSFVKDHKADYYFMGHTHKLFDITIQHNPNPYTIVNTGTLLGQPIYGQKRAWAEPIKGYYIFNTITKELKKMVL